MNISKNTTINQEKREKNYPQKSVRGKIATLLQAGLCIGLCGLEMCCNVCRGAE